MRWLGVLVGSSSCLYTVLERRMHPPAGSVLQGDLKAISRSPSRLSAALVSTCAVQAARQLQGLNSLQDRCFPGSC